MKFYRTIAGTKTHTIESLIDDSSNGNAKYIVRDKKTHRRFCVVRLSNPRNLLPILRRELGEKSGKDLYLAYHEKGDRRASINEAINFRATLRTTAEKFTD